jgi:hypothetical protein
MMRLTRLVAVSALLCGYLLLRQFGVGPAAAALAIALLVWSQQWWLWVSGELSWCSWWPLYLFAAVTAFAWGLHRSRGAWRAGLLIGTGCCAAAALSAFDAWLWMPTFLAALFGLMPRRAATIRRRLLVGLVCACAATGVGVGGRVVLNWWYFGSLHAVVRDLDQAYQARSEFVRPAEYTRENAANYWEVPRQPRVSSRWEWIATYYRALPANLARTYWPPPPHGAWITTVAVALALPTWWGALRRRQRAPQAGDAWPSAARGLIAMTVAPMAFVVALPAINVQQPWGLLGFAPAVLLLGGLTLDAAAATLVRIVNYLQARVAAGAAGPTGPDTAAGRAPGVGRAAVTTVAALTAMASLMVRLPATRGQNWPLPIGEFRAAVNGIADIEGLVFVNASDSNPMMYLAPVDSPVALKPVSMLRIGFFKDTRPVRLLFAESLGHLRRSVLSAGERELRPGLPPGWWLITVEDRDRLWPAS